MALYKRTYRDKTMTVEEEEARSLELAGGDRFWGSIKSPFSVREPNLWHPVEMK